MAILQYSFAVVGASAVDKAFASIERRAIQHNQRMNRAFGTTGTRTGRARPGSGVSPAVSAEKQLQMEQRRTARQAEVQARQKARAQERAAQKAATAEKREIDRVNRYWMEQKRKQNIFQQRQLDKQRRMAERAAMTEFRERRRAASGMVGAVGRSAGGSLRAVGTMGAGALAIGGGFAVSSAIRGQLSQGAAASALANQAFREGEGPSRQELRRGVLRQARSIGTPTGLGAEGVIGGLRQMTAISGRMDLGQQLMPFLADVTDATDSDVGDVGRTAGQIVQALTAKGIYTDLEILEQTKDIIKSMAGQAKVGSIEFQDLAQQMGKVMSATSGYEGKVSDLAATMGAVAQLAIAGGASSPEEAMTAIMRFRDDLVQNSKKFRTLDGKGGVSVFTDASKTEMREPTEILFDMLKSTGGNLEKVGSVFGVRAKKAVEPFQQAFIKAGGGEQGLDAVRKVLDSVRGTKSSDAEIAGSAAFRRAQDDRQFAIAMAQFNQPIGTELLPVITKLIPEFAKMVPHVKTLARLFGKFVSDLVDNPLAGLGKVIAAKVAFDIASARIGLVVSRALTAGLAGKAPASGGVPVAGRPASSGSAPMSGGPSAGGKSSVNLSGAVLNGVSLGVMGAMTIMSSGIVNFEAREVRSEQIGSDLAAIREMTDPEQLPEARERLKRIQKASEEESKVGFVETAADIGVSALKAGVRFFLPTLKDMPGLKDDEHTRRAAREIANFTTARDEGAIKFAEKSEDEARTKVRELEQKAAEAQAEAAKKLEEAAEKTSSAADKLSKAGPNRGDTPTSPVSI